MEKFFRLEEFDDFLEVAAGGVVFYQVNERQEDKLELIAYYDNVYWKGEFTNSIEMNVNIQLLREISAKQIVETSDRVFR